MRGESDISIMCDEDIYGGHGSADPRLFIGDNLVITIKIKNDGKVAFNSVRVGDLLPKGMKYISDNMHGGIRGRYILWRDVGPLRPNEEQMIKLEVLIDGTVKDDLINKVYVVGTSHEGETAEDVCILELSHEKKRGIIKKKKDLIVLSKELIELSKELLLLR